VRLGRLFVVVLAGCGFSAGPSGTAIDASGDGGSIDARLDDAFAFDVNVDLCYSGSGGYRVCLPSMPTSSLVLAGTIDTTPCTGGFVLAPGASLPDLCVMSGTTVTATGAVRVIGARPLAIVATQDLTIGSGATLDASSIVGGTRGAGANLGTCNAGSPPGGSSGGGGGGAGGSFQSRGGAGGGGMGTAGGTSGVTVTTAFVRGGCRGQPGGGATPGSGGDSGGSIYLVAGARLQIDGQLNASGAGGGGATGSKSGGGGGGSGGMITLYGSPIVIGSGARIWANGGGGGGGGSSSSAGTSGGQAVAPGGGGSAGSGDGAGGVGAAQVMSGAPGMQGAKGGGGGGGGVGVIENVTGGLLAPGTFSPPAI